MSLSREQRLWGLEGGCGAQITKLRVRKPKRWVANVIRIFDKEPFTIIYESSIYMHLLDKQDVGDHLIIQGMPLMRKRYREHPNIRLIRVFPTGLSYLVE